MSAAISVGDRVDIKVGDEKDGWGIVSAADESLYHVAMYGSGADIRCFERHEIRKPRFK